MVLRPKIAASGKRVVAWLRSGLQKARQLKKGALIGAGIGTLLGAPIEHVSEMGQFRRGLESKRIFRGEQVPDLKFIEFHLAREAYAHRIRAEYEIQKEILRIAQKHGFDGTKVSISAIWGGGKLIPVFDSLPIQTNSLAYADLEKALQKPVADFIKSAEDIQDRINIFALTEGYTTLGQVIEHFKKNPPADFSEDAKGALKGAVAVGLLGAAAQAAIRKAKRKKSKPFK
ncbi:MAG TPA: hypothetical protein VJG83_00595 [archaeon]|nr:hypothetical protein [archaeon]